MATHGARRLLTMAGNALNIVALEFSPRARGVDFRAPLKTSPRLQHAHSALRLKVPFAQTDRLLAPDIADAAATVRRPRYSRSSLRCYRAADDLGSLHSLRGTQTGAYSDACSPARPTPAAHA